MSGHTAWASIKRKRKPQRAIHLSREAIEAYVPTEACIIISITDPATPEAKLPVDHLLVQGVYRIEPFHDIDLDDDGEGRMAAALRQCDPSSYVLYDHERAHKLAVALTLMGKVHGLPPLIVVHCEAGIYRSSAIAAALQMHYRMDGESAFRTGLPNRLVYRLTLNALTALRGPRS